jgi:hypothetical protein
MNFLSVRLREVSKWRGTLNPSFLFRDLCELGHVPSIFGTSAGRCGPSGWTGGKKSGRLPAIAIDRQHKSTGMRNPRRVCSVLGDSPQRAND